MIDSSVQREKHQLRVFPHTLSETQSWCADDESDGFHRYSECCWIIPGTL